MRREYTMVVAHDNGFVTEELAYNFVSDASPIKAKVWDMLQKHLNQPSEWRIVSFYSHEVK